MNELLYPPSPAQVDDRILAPSLSFKAQTVKVIFSIFLFLIVYLLLVVAALALAVACFYIGGMVIMALHNIVIVIMGLGLMGVGVAVIYFLIKFIFSVSKDEDPSRVEIREEDEPLLFEFIRRLSMETKTRFPKKIYVSPRVNASVFYNSSFWSMFFPVKKNLEIGLGLVNTLNISEFKAVVAHEFGHFSQRSMKLGSFTYNVNRIIYNMLYDNKGYLDFLNAWARIHKYMVIFVRITAGIANWIQWLLRGMYMLVNKGYQGLSREMEFHADAVAARVAGGNNAITALTRIEIGDKCYSEAVDNANSWLKQNRVSKNIFANQLSILDAWAKRHKLSFSNGLPEISYEFISSFSKSRINYKNQWASHPTLGERKSHLDGLSLDVEPRLDSAWALFSSPNTLQEQLTAKLYDHITFETKQEICDNQFFEEDHFRDKDKYVLPAAYKGFYDNRYMDVTTWDIDSLKQKPVSKIFDQLFTIENSGLQSSINCNENDINLVEAIQSKQIDVKTFDFDGIKYGVGDCEKIIGVLNADVSNGKATLENLDKESFTFFARHAGEKSAEIENAYKAFQSVSLGYNEYAETANKVLDIIQPFYQGGMKRDSINSAIGELKSHSEKKLKKLLQQIIHEKDIVDGTTNPELLAEIVKFLSGNYLYFVSNEFQSHELNELREVTIAVANEYNEYKFRSYKKLLEDQLRLVGIS